MGRSIYLEQDRYVVALRRLLSLIEGGREMHAEDSTLTGCEDTVCSWGMCAKDRVAWPDAEDHLWPDQFESEGRVAPKYMRGLQHCPLDTNAFVPSEPLEGVGEYDNIVLSTPAVTGCFYRCLVFQRDRASGRLPREEAVKLYRKLIELRSEDAEGARS